MGIIKRAGDLVYTFRFLRLLTTKFEDTEAFKLGIIDKDGKRLKSYDLNNMDNRSNYKEYYTPFHRLVFNIKKLLAKAPGGDTRLASYAAALYLLKENLYVNQSPKDKLHFIKRRQQLGDKLISGDVAGVRINLGFIVPPCPPPDINIEDWKNSINILRSLPLKKIYLQDECVVTAPQQVKVNLADTIGILNHGLIAKAKLFFSKIKHLI